MSKTERPSVYLVDRCEAMNKVLTWLLEGQHNKPVNDKLRVFVAQLDFWDWEIENLMFSFDNFVERSEAWGNPKGMADSIRSRIGVLVQTKGGEVDSSWYRRQYYDKSQQVVAPLEKLNALIGKWNRLLTICEERVLVNEEKVENYVTLGASLLPNLDKYRKKLKDSSLQSPAS